MVKVLFIAGGGRTGSTTLHNVLGQVDGLAAVGELRYISGRGVLNNQLCGCGVPFAECPFWREVMQQAFGGVDAAFAREMLAHTESFRIRNLPLVAFEPTRRRELDRLTGYRERLARLYAAIHAVSGCRVIVDSSKNPSYGYVLRHVDGVEPHVLHFVRDAPPVAHSWGRHKEFEPGVPMARKGPAAAALQWLARNATAELFLGERGTPRMRLRSEDLMQRPRDHVESIVRKGRRGRGRVALHRPARGAPRRTEPLRVRQQRPLPPRAGRAAPRRQLAAADASRRPAAGRSDHAAAAPTVRLHVRTTAGPAPRRHNRRAPWLR